MVKKTHIYFQESQKCWTETIKNIVYQSNCLSFKITEDANRSEIIKILIMIIVTIVIKKKLKRDKKKLLEI